MTDSWDVFDKTRKDVVASKTTQRLEEMSAELYKLNLEKITLEERISVLEGDISRLFPEESGSQSKELGLYEVIVSRTERWSWDKDALEKHFEQKPLPHYVKRNLSIDKRAFTKMPLETQNEIKYCLTRNLDKPKVRVVKHVQDV